MKNVCVGGFKSVGIETGSFLPLFNIVFFVVTHMVEHLKGLEKLLRAKQEYTDKVACCVKHTSY